MKNKKSKVLTALVMAGLLSGVCASGFAAVPEEKIFGNYKDVECTFDTDKFLVLRVWDVGTEVVYPAKYIGTQYEKQLTNTPNRGLLQVGDKIIALNSSLKTEEESIKAAGKYFYELVGQPKNGTPVIHLILKNTRDSNASSLSMTKDKAKGNDISQYFQAASKDALDTDDYYVSLIDYRLPATDLYSYVGLNVLQRNGINAEAHTSFFVHELGHTFGVSTKSLSAFEPKEDWGITYKDITQFDPNWTYNNGLRDAFGEASYSASNEGKITKHIEKSEFDAYCKSGTKPDDIDKYFYVVDVQKSGGTYFTGTNVAAVLDGAKIAWPNESDMPAVPGVPINGFNFKTDKDGKDMYEHTYDLSHLEMQNGVMSFQTYITWGVFMEAELAVFQDLGYTINRRKAFGGSMYKSGTADARNIVENALITLDGNSEDILKDNAYVSSQDYAVGYHVYGSYNDVQNFKYGIKPTGSGAVGIRVDGVGNTINLNKEIEVSGADGTGVMFSYGKNHELTVDSSIKATGDGGVAIRFDFGDNILGNNRWYRGSYINTYLSDGKWYDSTEVFDAQTGPLMKEVTINRPIEGKKYAIYIADNAYVQKMTINADITGDIVSEWNPVPDVTKLKIHSKMLANGGITNPAVELTTALQMNSNITVLGNIKGAASLDMTIAKDTITLVTGDVAVHALKSEGGTLKVGYQKNVDTGDYSEFTGNIIWEEGDVEGSWLKTFNQGSQTSYTERPNQANTALSQMNAAAIMGWRAQNNDMNKRMGELRMKNGEKGVWARMSRGENKEDATKRQFNLYQVGYDQEIGNKWILGGALSMTKGNANTSAVSGYAKGEDKSGAFSLYASRLNDDGSFIDLVAKYGKTSYDVTSYMITGMGNYDYSTPSMSVSAEIGKRLKKGAYWMEPQAEFTFGMVKSASYTTSNGVTAEQERFNSAVGRIGAVFGRDLPEGNIYVRASFLHDFAGNSDLNLIQNKISRSYTNDLGGSWWEFGIGTNLKTGKHSYIYADVEKTCGGKMQMPWRWNLGARWSF